MTKRILITGMSGLIGGLLKEHLTNLGGYQLSALNRSIVDGTPTHSADIANLDQILPAFENIDVVVHLAAYLGSDNFKDQLPVNIVGTYNVFEAARMAGIKRVIYASSGSTIRGVENIYPYKEIAEGKYTEVKGPIPLVTHKDVRPGGVYGATKVWGEALARHFSDAYDMSMICVRIGSVTKGDIPSDARQKSIYLSHKDVCQILQLSIEAPSNLKYEVFLATSNNRWSYRDLEHPRTILGYHPLDSAEDL
ncbi:NAD(P)-dependent oxidoreductase [Chloroflexi bacterium]|nr:NAD(P)-dependent oxidoreductase [Chloroflexota bacterium]